MLSVIIGGDVMPSFKNLDYFSEGKTQLIIDESVRAVFSSSDYRVFNLETPLTDELAPIAKEGANFAIPTTSINGLKAIGADVLSLANNHIKDQGEMALIKTVDLLNKNGIYALGYGKSFSDCCSRIRLEREDLTVSIIACTESEFTVWDGEELGAIPYHDYWINKIITDAKKDSDCVIVLYHGGKEYYPYVAPYQKERCRLMIDNGADFVLCQHSHCIACFEKYKDATILYGQGNCIFHQKNNKEITKEGLIAKITIDAHNKDIEFIPVILNENDTLCLADEARKREILNGFHQRSEAIKDPESVQSLYSEFAQKKLEYYLNRFRGSNRFNIYISRIMNKFGIKIYNDKDILTILNTLQNEAHRELLIQALKDELKRDRKEKEK